MLSFIPPGSPILLPALSPHTYTEFALGSEFQMYKLKPWFMNNGQIILPFQELEKFKVKILTSTP